MRRLTAQELKLWAQVAQTVTPVQGRSMPDVDMPPKPAQPILQTPAPMPVPSGKPATGPAPAIDTKRQKRIASRDLVEARIDLHGMTEPQARDALIGFLHRCQAQGLRVVLVITGKGRDGEGLLKRRLPDWLSDAQVRVMVGGYTHAGRKHGGDGAYYIALKRAAD